MKLEIKGGRDADTLIGGTIDLGEPDEGGYIDGQTFGGNLYLHVDGEEWGSLFFYAQGGKLQVSLGQYDDAAGEWTEKARLTETVQQIIDREVRIEHEPRNWFTRGTYPSCSCDFAPDDNLKLTEHWRALGIRWVDNGGTLVCEKVSK